MAWIGLGRSTFKSVSGDPDPIQDGRHQDPSGKMCKKSLKPVIQFKANMTLMVLRWSTFKIVTGDLDFHPRWPPSADNFNIGYYGEKCVKSSETRKPV